MSYRERDDDFEDPLDEALRDDELDDAWAAEHDAHVAGGKAAHAPKTYVDDWRTKYGEPPRGDPMRSNSSRRSPALDTL